MYLSFKSLIDHRSLDISFVLKHYLNHIYFNDIVLPVQSTESVLYSNLKLEKRFQFKYISLSSVICLQNSSDATILPVPFLFYDQKIQYDRLVFSDLRLLTSLNVRIFSKYYIPSYFPLTDIFYHQNNIKNGMKPLASLDISIYKENFSFGLIADNLQSFLYEGISLVQDYFLPPFLLRTSIKWQFID